MYGGSTTSILVNVPGETASVVTCFDGYPMALQGRAGPALGIAAFGSFIAGTLGLVGLMLFAPSLAELALKFGPPEYFAITLCGIIILSNLSGGGTVKSILMIILGMMAASVGMDGITSFQRMTFGVAQLDDGFNLVAVLMGLFGLAEVFSVIQSPPQRKDIIKVKFRDLYPKLYELKESVGPIIRGSVVGFVIGLLPGPAPVVAAFGSYKLEKIVAKHPENFGHGAIQGVAGPESANNSAVCAAMVPLFSLGLAFTPSIAILIGALRIQGIIAGPNFITEHAGLFWAIIASMYIGNVILLILNLPFVGIFASLLNIPSRVLMPLIVVIIFFGSYTANNSIFDIGIAVIFGLFGYFLRLGGFDVASLIIGFLLGPIVEESFRQSIGIFQGSYMSFFMRPVSGSILFLSIFIIVFKIVLAARKRIKNYKK
jgi:putative tricarboxylic transport membrane protein